MNMSSSLEVMQILILLWCYVIFLKAHLFLFISFFFEKCLNLICVSLFLLEGRYLEHNLHLIRNSKNFDLCHFF